MRGIVWQIERRAWIWNARQHDTIQNESGSGKCNNNIYIQFKTPTNGRINLPVAQIGLRLVVAKMNELRNDMGWQKLAVVGFFSAVMSM